MFAPESSKSIAITHNYRPGELANVTFIGCTEAFNRWKDRLVVFFGLPRRYQRALDGEGGSRVRKSINAFSKVRL